MSNNCILQDGIRSETFATRQFLPGNLLLPAMFLISFLAFNRQVLQFAWFSSVTLLLLPLAAH